MGVSAEARRRIASLSIASDWDTSSGEWIDLPGVVGVLAPQLPALQTLDLPELGTTSARSGFAALMHAAIAAGAPALHELRLQSSAGVLTGVGALAACSSLRTLLVSGSCFGDSAVPLQPRLLTELSKLRALETLEVPFHDPSGGARLAALLGGRRPAALRTLRLLASVPRDQELAGPVLGSGDEQVLHLPHLAITFEPGAGRMEEVKADGMQQCLSGPSLAAFDKAAQVLAAAAGQLQDSSIGSFVIEGLATSTSSEQDSISDQQLVQCLAPGAHLARLLQRCGSAEFLEFRRLGASVERACTVLGALGMPATLHLCHGPFEHPRRRPPSDGGAQLPPLPRTRGAPQPGQSVQPLQLESATAEGVLQEAVERLWLAATEAGAAGTECGTSRCGGGTERCGDAAAIVLRGVPKPHVVQSGSSIIGREFCNWLDALCGFPAATPAAGASACVGLGAGKAAAAALGAGMGAEAAGKTPGPSRLLPRQHHFCSVPHMGTHAVFVEAGPVCNAVGVVAAAAAAAARGSGAAREQGRGGAGSSTTCAAEPRGAFAAAVLPCSCSLGPAARNCPWPYMESLYWAVLQVLTELWDRRSRGDGDVQEGGGGGSSGGGGAAGSGASRRRRLQPLGAAELEHVRRLLELDLQVSGLRGYAMGQREPS